MALNITYERSALADFLERLPSMLLDFKQTQLKLATEEKIRKDNREYQASVSMYQDARDLYKVTRKELNTLETSYAETGMNISSLNDIYSTAAGLKPLQDIGDIDIQNWEERTEYYGDLTSNLERKKEALKGVLYGDVQQAQQIMAGGGVGGYSGGDPDQWDLSDIGLDAYEQTYGPAPEYIKDYFGSQPGLMRKSLTDLNQALLNFDYKETIHAENKQQLLTKKRNQSLLYMGTLASEWYKGSGLAEFDGLLTHEAADKDGTAPFKKGEKESVEFDKKVIVSKIGEDFATLLGKAQDGLDKPLDYFHKYQEMYDNTVGRGVTRLGQVAEGDFSDYTFYIKQSYNVYKALEGSEKIKFERLARQYFGFGKNQTFDQFVKAVSENYSKITTLPFDINGQFDDDANESDEWDEDVFK